MLKKGLALFLAVVIIFSLSGGCTRTIGGIYFLYLVATGDDSAEKAEVFAFVWEHEAELLQAIQSEDFSAYENQGFIKEIDADETVVDFSCGGAGVGSGTSYVGFYYTPGNDMTAVWCAPQSPDSLTAFGNGYAWHQSDGDNIYYTEHICGNFYYYEASF